eukprot:1856531-Pleurochrysis_carterae.AAC.1
MRRRRRCDGRDDGLAVLRRQGCGSLSSRNWRKSRRHPSTTASPKRWRRCSFATMLCESACREESMRVGVVAAWQGCFRWDALYEATVTERR